jgi:hypothetical protein
MILGDKDTIALNEIARSMYESIKTNNKKHITIDKEGHNYSNFHVLQNALDVLSDDLLQSK